MSMHVYLITQLSHPDRLNRERASLRIPSDPFLPIFPLMWRGVRGSSYRGGGLPLLTPSRNDNTTSPPPHVYVMCMYVSLLFFLVYAL